VSDVSLTRQERGVSARPAPHAVAAATTWGWLPLLSVTAACGVFLVSVGDTEARMGQPWAEAFLWIGLVVLFAPVAARLMWHGLGRNEGLGLTLILGVGLYLTKFLHSPLGFTFPDELMHVRTAEDILLHRHLLFPNPLLPVSPYYPALEIVTTSIATLTGSSIFISGLIVLAVLRVILVFSLYGLLHEISRSPRIAGMGVVLYMANSNFLSFSSIFAYESLGIPFMFTVLFILVKRESMAARYRFSLAAIALSAMVVIITGHHVSALALLLLLVTWAAVRGVIRLFHTHVRGPSVMPFALASLIGTTAYILVVAHLTIGYLAPQLRGAITALMSLIAREQNGNNSTRQLFHSSGGLVAPAWERGVAIAAVLCILVVLPIGVWQVYKRYSLRPLAIVLGLAALLYPCTLALRLVGASWQIGNRSSEFVFLPLCFVLGSGIVLLWLPGRFTFVRTLTAMLWASIIFIGGAVTSGPHVLHMPGPYLQSADERSVVPNSIAAASWMRVAVGSGNVVASDWSNNLLLGSMGQQEPALTSNGSIDTSYFFFAATLSSFQKHYMHTGRIHYIVIDNRLSTYVPLGTTFQGYNTVGEKYAGRPVPKRLLRKFTLPRRSERLYDNGDLYIYDVSRVGRTS